MASPRRRLAALLTLCRVLGGKVGPLSAPRRPARFSRPTDWNDVLDLAVELAVAPALFPAIRPIESTVPPEIVDRLRECHQATAIQNLRFRHRLVEALKALNAVGIVPLVVKGGLRLVDGTAERLGDRSMVDVDIALALEDQPAALEALRGVGYRSPPVRAFVHPHELSLLHDRAPGPLDLHVELGVPPIPSMLPLAAAWDASTEFSFHGARARALSPTDQALHNVLHSALEDFDHAVAALPLRQLLSLTRLARVHGSAIDWAAIRARMAVNDLSAVLADHLWLAHRLAGLDLPPGPWGGVGARLHETRVLASFGLGWPADLQRNLRHAFGSARLDALYGHGDRPLMLAAARGRHAVHVLRHDARGAVRETLERKLV